MNYLDCYRILGLRPGSSLREVKAAYRRLVRNYHPDLNSDRCYAPEQFITLTKAYKTLEQCLTNHEGHQRETSPLSPRHWSANPAKYGNERTTSFHPSHGMITGQSMPLALPEQHLKQTSVQYLQEHLHNQRFPRAIALVEGMVQRFPQDLEVKRWQAIAYWYWGRHLMAVNQPDKARVYFKKAQRTTVLQFSPYEPSGYKPPKTTKDP
ncbi:MAG: J domain-containing protein [Synechococcales bacterium]|nr:J domain-containing protein [Cyanobacteria bacterium REEB444]MEB3124426.1 J domain-containing protein [Synechococcales bacterium]